MVDTKSTDNSTTLSQYLVRILEGQAPQLLKLNEDIPHVAAAAKISLQNLTSEVNSLAKDFRTVKNSMELFTEKDKFVEIMTVIFYLFFINKQNY